MTPDTAALVLESLRAGVPLPAACRAARTTEAAVRRAADDDDDFAAELDAALAEGGAERARLLPPAPVEVPAIVPATAREGGARHAAAGAAKRSTAAPPLDFARVAREAAEMGPGTFGCLLWQDDRLVRAGFPAMSAWWRATLAAFYAAVLRWLIVRVGRGGGKSTTLTRVAACETVFTPRVVPPGQRWIWPFISVSTTDAARRIFEIRAILNAIGVVPDRVTAGYSPSIELTDARGNEVGLVALASTIAGVSGPSTIGATIDEEAKLRDRATNANPASEIVASLIQTFRARDGIRAVRCSSAWDTDGSHARSIAQGTTGATFVATIGEAFLPIVLAGLHDVAALEEQRGDATAAARVRAYAATVTAASPNVPTWLANPTITAVRSREEVDAMPEDTLGGLPRIAYWLRENASVPLPSAGGGGGEPARVDWDWFQRAARAGHAAPADMWPGRSGSGPGFGGSDGGGGVM